MKSSQHIRETFLDFFKSKGHTIVKSAPIVLKDDPTLLFVNAGMNQFKDSFLGLKIPKSTKIADSQKCLRASGKHNDLEEVGHDTYHHTMFEMLGNWSFGDYYKVEAIEWAWELLTKVYKIDAERIYVTIFEGNKEDGLPLDKDAQTEWRKWIAPERILPFGKKDNFWEMGATGPSGPCSEIHVDLRSEAERAAIDGASLVNEDHPEVVEIWNLVFIQYDRKSDGSLEELPDKHIDTGMGFERLCMALQGVKSTYDTDLFNRSKAFIQSEFGVNYVDAPEEQRIAIRVIIDHIRAIVFAIADGQLPSNVKAGHVIRRILRRAARYAFSYLGSTKPFLYKLVNIVAEDYKGVFDEVTSQQNFISRIIQEEEIGFLDKLKNGSKMFEEYLQTHPDSSQIEGDFAFKLTDTFGFPIDLTEVMAKEQGRSVDMEAYTRLLDEQKNRSRTATEQTAGDWIEVNPSQDLPRFRGYDLLELQTQILKYRTVKTAKKNVYHLVLEETPFYAESGGQVGDKGTIFNESTRIKVLDTQKENDLIIHVVDRLPENPDDAWTAQVFSSFRQQVEANHTATHLLHAALRKHLGQHVEQRGSLVSDKALRFDFSHFAKVTDEELAVVEQEVNDKIRAAIPFVEHRSMPIEEAKELGAMALFGEKYGDTVRVVIFDPEYSVELCGGTHVGNSSEIRLFKLTSEGSVAAGIRRIEALTSNGALAYFQKRMAMLDEIAGTLKSPQNLPKAVHDLVDRNQELEKELASLNAAKVQQLKGELLEKGRDVNGINLIAEQVQVGSADDLKQLSFDLKRSTQNSLIVLAAIIKEKPLLSVIVSDDLAETNRFHAGNMIRTLAKEIKGGGGGQPFYATAGGKDIGGIARALEVAAELVKA